MVKQSNHGSQSELGVRRRSSSGLRAFLRFSADPAKQALVKEQTWSGAAFLSTARPHLPSSPSSTLLWKGRNPQIFEQLQTPRTL